MRRDNNCLDRFPEVVAAMREVVEKGGFGTSVTPVSQFYFQQAFANVMQGPWKTITKGYGRMVLGYFGKTPAEPDPEIVKLAAQQLKLEPTTENPRDLNDKNPNLGRAHAEQVLKENNLPITDENVFIIATCDEAADPKGLKFLKGARPMGCRFVSDATTSKETKKETHTMANNAPAAYTVVVNGKPYAVQVIPGGAPVITPVAAAPAAAPAAAAAKGTEVTAPMPGTVLRIEVSIGQAVKKGDNLITIEAMKMEQEIKATADGTVAAINVAQGDTVESGQVVAII
jgi:pyruvate carboxylase subunit B